jgi:hypothetical protein
LTPAATPYDCEEDLDGILLFFSASSPFYLDFDQLLRQRVRVHNGGKFDYDLCGAALGLWHVS